MPLPLKTMKKAYLVCIQSTDERLSALGHIVDVIQSQERTKESFPLP